MSDYLQRKDHHSATFNARETKKIARFLFRMIRITPDEYTAHFHPLFYTPFDVELITVDKSQTKFVGSLT